jgi:hypothetical protein
VSSWPFTNVFMPANSTSWTCTKTSEPPPSGAPRQHPPGGPRVVVGASLNGEATTSEVAEWTHVRARAYGERGGGGVGAALYLGR